MNRRGAVLAIYLTVVVAIALSTTALFNFLTHAEAFGSSAKDNEMAITHHIAMQEYLQGTAKAIMKETAGEEFTRENVQKAAARRNLNIAGQGDFFDKIERGEFEIRQESGTRVLGVENILLFSQSGKSSIKRTFTLQVESDASGDEIRFINN